MKKLPRVTLVAIACTRVEETLRAMERSMAHIQFADALLITDKQIAVPAGITLVPIERLDYAGYNHFVLYRLKDYIETDFALIVQHDGYVLRPHAWSDEFLQYDYCGAPWAPNTHFTPEKTEVRVGNGGFSLRSKKLLEMPTAMNLPFNDGGSGFINEDGIICVHYRAALEKRGIRYAPVAVAARFSTEKRNSDSYSGSFGFHYASKSRRGALYLRLIGIKTDLGIFLHKINRKVAFLFKHHFLMLRRQVSSLLNSLFFDAKAVAEYRKTIKIYDVFTFLNEFDLLEIRLNILDPYVDYFVIIEADETFSGKQKPLYFAENKKRFEKWQHKIIHYVTTGVPADEQAFRDRLNRTDISELERNILNGALTSPNVGRDKKEKPILVWLKEFYQKESIKKALADANLSDNDICYVSDVDEIWNPHARIDYRSDGVFKIMQRMYAYFLNNRSSEPWIGPMVTKYKNIKNNYLNHLRTERHTRYTYVRNGGWHFTNIGGIEQIKKKLESYGHQEYNTPEIRNTLEQKIAKNKDFIGRGFTFWVDERDLPSYLLENRDRYKTLFK